MRIVLHIPDLAKPVHGGAWNARYLQAGGEISKEEADRIIAQARIARRKSKSRLRGSHA